MEVYIGLDIGGTKILGAIFDENQQIIRRVKKKTKAVEGVETVIQQLIKVVDSLIDEIEELDGTLLGIGAGSPGIIIKESTIAFCPNIPFDNFDLGKMMEERYKVPFILGNDVNVAMYGEWKAANIKNAKNVLGVFVGTGVGGAIIIDGKLYTGQGGAGEIGHMVINPGGLICGCGSQGCLEAYASKTGIQKATVAALRKGRKSVLSDAMSENGGIIKSSALKTAYEEGDHLAVEVITDAMRYLGIAVSNLINIFHPDLIIMGGGMMESMGYDLMPMMKNEAIKHTMTGLFDDVEFQLSQLNDDAGIYGAYQLISND